MPLISVENVVMGFDQPMLLDGIGFRIEPGEKIGLMGRNGAGKSTLMKLLAGFQEPLEGTIKVAEGRRVAYLPQDVPLDLTGSIQEIVTQGLGEVGDLLEEYHRVAASGQVAEMNRLEDLQHELDVRDGWLAHRQVEQIITRMELDPTAEFSRLSSGMKRRVLLAKSLVLQPDLLLLDEPTNHLDIAAISWLEEFLQRYDQALLFVTHDRMFLQKLATRIIEIDRGRLLDWEGNYENFLRRKAEYLAGEEQQQALFDKKLAEEEVWIRQGIKARRTRNEGRVRALEKMRTERQARRKQTGSARLEVNQSDRSGNMVLEAKGLGFEYPDRPIVRDFSTLIMRGDKIGIIGPNGCGKSTLIKLLLGELTPQAGSVRLGTNLQAVYFDQLREQIDETKTVVDNVGEGQQSLLINGRKKHVMGYLQDFLFSPERARRAARYLSGGEKNRLLLAKLFTKPANVLVMDEPTNDLDMETLELLEELLLDFPGTLLLVSHDRAFLNNVVTSTIAFDEPGQVREYDGGYDDWQRQRRLSMVAATPAEKKPAAEPRKKNAAGRKLSFKEQKELDSLPGRIEELEARLGELHQQMGQPQFYQQGKDEIARVSKQAEELQTQLDEAFARWELLEAVAAGNAPE